MNKNLLIFAISLLGLAANAAASNPDSVCPTGYAYSNGQCLMKSSFTDASCPQGYVALNGQCITGAISPFASCSEQTRQALSKSFDLQTLSTTEKTEYAKYDQLRNSDERISKQVDDLEKTRQSLIAAKKDLSEKVDGLSLRDQLSMSKEAKDKIAHAQVSIDEAINTIENRYLAASQKAYDGVSLGEMSRQAICVRELRAAIFAVQASQKN